jgi:hypothetical protein
MECFSSKSLCFMEGKMETSSGSTTKSIEKLLRKAKGELFEHVARWAHISGTKKPLHLN